MPRGHAQRATFSADDRDANGRSLLSSHSARSPDSMRPRPRHVGVAKKSGRTALGAGGKENGSRYKKSGSYRPTAPTCLRNLKKSGTDLAVSVFLIPKMSCSHIWKCTLASRATTAGLLEDINHRGRLASRSREPRTNVFLIRTNSTRRRPVLLTNPMLHTWRLYYRLTSS